MKNKTLCYLKCTKRFYTYKLYMDECFIYVLRYDCMTKKPFLVITVTKQNKYLLTNELGGYKETITINTLTPKELMLLSNNMKETIFSDIV